MKPIEVEGPVCEPTSIPSWPKALRFEIWARSFYYANSEIANCIISAVIRPAW